MTSIYDVERLAALQQLGLLDQPQEERFRRITDVARRLLQAPRAYLNLVDAERLWVTACVGDELVDADRRESFCQYAVMEDAPVLVYDATVDERFRHSSFVTGPGGLRAYAGHPLRAPSGHVVGTLCVTDVVPRMWTEDDVRTLTELSAWAELELAHGEVQRQLALGARAQRLNESVLSSAAEAICAIDADGRITMVNPAVARVTGWPAEELLGRRIHDTLHGRHADGSDYPEHECPLFITLAAGEILLSQEELYWRKDGSPFPVQMSCAPMREGDEVVGAVVVFEDVTARQEVERMKEEFVSVVSHELRTPLTSMRGSLGLLAAGVVADLPAEAKGLVDMALANTERLVRLVGEILDLERLTAGQVQLRRAEHRLREVVETAVTSVSSLAETAGVQVEQQVDDVTGWFDSDRVVQVLVNLVGNAVKFTPAGGCVTVSAGPDGEQVRIAVADTGRGIPPEMLRTVFDRFAQVEGGDAREKGGTGLGLAIARSIVEAHGGRITVDSVVGVGSTFTVLLPQRSGRPSDPRAPRRRAEDA